MRYRGDVIAGFEYRGGIGAEECKEPLDLKKARTWSLPGETSRRNTTLLPP